VASVDKETFFSGSLLVFIFKFTLELFFCVSIYNFFFFAGFDGYVNDRENIGKESAKRWRRTKLGNKVILAQGYRNFENQT